MSRSSFILLIIGIISACSNDKLSYIDSISFISDFEYIEADIDKGVKVDTLISEKWYSAETMDIVLRSPNSIISTGDFYWVADPMHGNIYRTDSNGSQLKMFISKGYGPNETLHPASIYINPSKDDRVYVLDTSSRSIITYNYDGVESERFYSPWIIGEFYNGQLIKLEKKRFLVTIVNHETSIVGVLDEYGELIQTMVPRIIPIGYQPMTHNRVVFDFIEDKNLFVFAYKGMPLIFIENGSDKRVLNLKPKSDLHEIGTPLDRLPLNAHVAVSNLFRNVHIYGNTLFIQYNNSLIIYDLLYNEITRRVEFLDENKDTFGIHEMKLVGDELFLINVFLSQINKVDIADLMSFN